MIENVSADCAIETEKLTLILTPTGSYAGVTQIAARVVEVALHKAHVLEFDLSAIQKASGSTPISPPTTDSLTAMGAYQRQHTVRRCCESASELRP